MSINWQWKNKIGELSVIQKRGETEEVFQVSIYTGNADLIFIYEFEEEGISKYSLYNFYCDFDHFKRCWDIGFAEWKSIIFYEHNTKLAKYAKEFFKLGIIVTFDPNYKIVKEGIEE